MKKLLIASTSTLHGERYLEYLLPELEVHFKNCKTILFIPFARPGGITHDEYTDLVASAFAKINKNVVGLHTFEDMQTALKTAEGIFTGGGNTFLLVSQLYEYHLMSLLSHVIKNGIPYLGTSAGSNIAGMTMQTTNDMPIIYPPSFDTLQLLPFNLNPHYLDPMDNSTHMGETRETRIKEFHKFNDLPVLGLREGSWLDVKDEEIKLCGKLPARLFLKDKEAQEIPAETILDFQ